MCRRWLGVVVINRDVTSFIKFEFYFFSVGFSLEFPRNVDSLIRGRGFIIRCNIYSWQEEENFETRDCVSFTGGCRNFFRKGERVKGENLKYVSKNSNSIYCKI